MSAFATWEAAHAYAQAGANRDGLSRGIEKCDALGAVEWVVRYLPRRENRYGCDSRCEAVEPEICP